MSTAILRSAGAVNDALQLRPGLATDLREARGALPTHCLEARLDPDVWRDNEPRRIVLFTVVMKVISKSMMTTPHSSLDRQPRSRHSPVDRYGMHS
jgi:hypothetical protein